MVGIKALLWNNNEKDGMHYIDKEVELIAETDRAYKFLYKKSLIGNITVRKTEWLPKKLYNGGLRFEIIRELQNANTKS